MTNTAHVPQASASKRYEAARKIIAAHDAAVDAYADATDMDEAYAAEARMEDATSDAVGILRALITPPRVGESFDVDPADERLVRDGLDLRVVRQMEAAGLNLSDGSADVTIRADRLIRLVQDIARAEAHAGIQSAHETWEPEVALRPTQEQMLRWLGLDYDDGTSDTGDPSWEILKQYIEKETA